MTKVIIAYLICINIIEFLLLGIDKFLAIRKTRRISEKMFFIICLIGGSFGGINGMIFFRHKINKKKFYLFFPVISIFHIISLYLKINLI